MCDPGTPPSAQRGPGAGRRAPRPASRAAAPTAAGAQLHGAPRPQPALRPGGLAARLVHRSAGREDARLAAHAARHRPAAAVPAASCRRRWRSRCAGRRPGSRSARRRASSLGTIVGLSRAGRRGRRPADADAAHAAAVRPGAAVHPLVRDRRDAEGLARRARRRHPALPQPGRARSGASTRTCSRSPTRCGSPAGERCATSRARRAARRRWSGLRQSLGVAWLALIVAEQVNAGAGLGYLINNARDFLRTDIDRRRPARLRRARPAHATRSCARSRRARCAGATGGSPA